MLWRTEAVWVEEARGLACILLVFQGSIWGVVVIWVKTAVVGEGKAAMVKGGWYLLVMVV